MGSVIKNCRSKKMLNAPPPNHEGTQSGLKVFTQPIRWKRRNWGMSVTWEGSIMVPRVITKRRFLPRKRKRAKPYATSMALMTVPRVDMTTRKEVLMNHRPTG